jgi:hypothetical protein
MDKVFSVPEAAWHLPLRTVYMEFLVLNGPTLPSGKRNQLDVFIIEFRQGESI